MNNTIRLIDDNDIQLLQDELEQRYGPAAAQDIIDQLLKTQRQDDVTSCLLVKALCDMTGLFREEAKETLAAFRASRATPARYGDNVLSLEASRLEQKFRKIYRLYWISMKLYYPLYGTALAEMRLPKFPSPKTPRPSGAPRCRTVA